MSEDKKRIILKDWSVTQLSPYSPPEMGVCLSGKAYGHPRYADGEEIHTSRVVKSDKNIVTTYSGSVYELDEPDQKFVEYCKRVGSHVPTKYDPIRWVDSD